MPPLDPTLEDLSSMTHQPEQPNPAAPYINAARQKAGAFAQGGLTGAFPQLRQYMPGFVNTLGDLAQSPAARDVFSTANVGGMPLLEALRMEAAPASSFFSTFGGKNSFKMFSRETGKEMGQLHTTFNPSTKDLYINYMGGNEAGQGFGGYQNVGVTGWGIGTHELQTLGPEILKHYPDVQTVSFMRLPGIRAGAGAAQPGKAGRQSRNMKFKVNRTPDGNVTLERIESKAVPRIDYTPPPGRFITREASVPDASPDRRASSAIPAYQSPFRSPAAESAPGQIPRPPPLPPAPPPPPPAPPPAHGPGWTAEREESWDAMRARQDAEWNTLMQRLFGNR